MLKAAVPVGDIIATGDQRSLKQFWSGIRSRDNVGEAEPMSIIESPWHDTFWIESFDWMGFPNQRPSDPPTVVSTFVMKLAEAAVRGLHKPVWRCAQQCRMAATQRLYPAEAVAQGGNSCWLCCFFVLCVLAFLRFGLLCFCP